MTEAERQQRNVALFRRSAIGMKLYMRASAEPLRPIGHHANRRILRAGTEFPVVVFSPTATRVLNFAGDPLPDPMA